MYIVRIVGGLGNQMFSYAAGYALAKKNEQDLKVFRFEHRVNRWNYELDTLCLSVPDRYSKIPGVLKYRAVRRTIAKYVKHFLKLDTKWNEDYQSEYHYGYAVFEKKHAFAPVKEIPVDRDCVQYGYFQSYRYFDEYRQEIIAQFQPNFRLSAEISALIQTIEDADYATSIHIRRGDYVGIGWGISDAYYAEAIRTVLQTHPDTSFFVFSDDIAYAKQILKDVTAPVYYAEHPHKVPSFEDIWAMSKCDSNIIANSTFSFWGAYLNTHATKTVYAPSAVLALNEDILPESWNIISAERTKDMESSEG